MKILFVTDFFPSGKDLRFSGGVEARTFFLAKYLAQKNEVHVVCSRQKNSKSEEKMFNFDIHRVGPVLNYTSGSPSYLDFPKRLIFMYRAIKKGAILNPDIVDGGNFDGHFIAKRISLINKTPSIYWYPDVFIGQWLKTTGIIAGVGGWLLEKYNISRDSDHLIAISEVTVKKLLNQGIARNQISKIPCAVDPQEFTPIVKKDSPATIVTISRLVKYKRIKDLILAFAIVAKKNSSIRLKIIGSGSEKANLINLTKALKITDKINYYENLSRKRLICELKAAAIFCLPSEVEGFGISIIEAAAAHVPYVISDIPVFKEITKNGKGGLIFRLGNIRELANKLELLLGKKLYNRKVKDAYELSKLYNWKNVSLETVKVYKDLLNKRM